MANLAVVGSHSVNGVAALHTELLKRELFRDFHELWPERFNNKTNGVTPRRWLLQSNPAPGALITEVIGPGWLTDASELRRLEPLADDAGFRRLFREMKRENKERLAEIVRAENGLTLDLDSIFDVQVKRIHEYKRQLLAVLHVTRDTSASRRTAPTTRTRAPYLFGGKAAPGYAMAKWIIKLINSVADVVNHDADVRGRITVVFLKNYRVSLAERIFPAADLSEQISTAGKEASGTGNMKFALNGALTIGTLDGANVEIREEVGAENFFLFGLTVEQVAALRRKGYNPWEWYRGDRRIKAVLDAIASGVFSPGEPGLFRPIVDSLLNGGDPLPAAGRLRRLLRDPGRGRRGLPRPRAVDAHGDPERGPLRQVLLGPDHPRVRRGDLAGAAGHERLGRGRAVQPNSASATRPRASNRTPSASSSARCTAAPMGSRIDTAARPPGRAARTRCQGIRCRAPRSAASAYPTWRAAPGRPARSAIWP